MRREPPNVHKNGCLGKTDAGRCAVALPVAELPLRGRARLPNDGVDVAPERG